MTVKIQMVGEIIMKDRNKNKVIKMYNEILSMLPNQPRSYDVNDDPGFWTNGTEILCPSKMEKNVMVVFLTDLFSEFGDFCVRSGYYDPFEDARNDERDECSGFYYVDLE